MWAINRIIGVVFGLSVTVAEAAVPPSGPRIDALPQPASPPPALDLEAVARGYAASAQGPRRAADSGPHLLVFISLSMPRPSLQRLFAQAERARAVLVLRGLVNGSWRDTGAALQPLVERYRVALQIDPQAFDRYGIEAVPSVVLRKRQAACDGGTCPEAAAFVRVSGDVSLDYALAALQRAAPSFAADAEQWRQRLQPAEP
ncbi:type-F conjugative transfer system pilin assembly protein TrbC [Pseudomonas lundensis]|uniref:type-F conjugative transfer system pilin assembly protein TrbC n=1 Tax=Pseudomonas lundensis TaxID=86185 RepID=UPI001475FF50|nr:type-F conjugative transfer system pilin assembly protein TrbC [Pseudomonas lundensis]